MSKIIKQFHSFEKEKILSKHINKNYNQNI